VVRVQASAQDLYGDALLEIAFRPLGQVNGAHAARTELAHGPERADCFR
jgi:hypothetical protein